MTNLTSGNMPYLKGKTIMEITTRSEIIVRCDCGEDLSEWSEDMGQSDRAGGLATIEISPCEKCIENAKSEGYQQCEQENSL